MQNQLLELRDFYQAKLLDECLPFWLDHAVDHEFGGFITSLNRDGSVVDTDKNVWQQGRFTWLLGELHNDPYFAEAGNSGLWLEFAKGGAEFLQQHCFDPADGRMWFQLNRQGDPIRKRRYAFSESFAAIAFGELAQATGDERFQSLARNCFDEFLTHPQRVDPANQKFTDHRPTQSIGFPMISLVTAQELRSSISLDSADEQIDRAIESVRQYFVKPDLKSVMETVGKNGELLDHFDGRTLNPGHAIEAAWFIMDEGRHRQKTEWIELGTQMLEWMFERGWDDEHGGLLYFVDVNGLPVQEYWHDMKFWWPHNETIIATLLAYQLTNEQRYLDMHQKVHQWAFDHFSDREFGEWFGYLHRDGTLSVPLKGNHWKGPFHYPRMLLQCVRILNRML